MTAPRDLAAQARATAMDGCAKKMSAGSRLMVVDLADALDAALDEVDRLRVELAAARAPRLIETVEQLNALPYESVIRSASGLVEECVDHCDGRAQWFAPGVRGVNCSELIALPAVLLWSPDNEVGRW